MMAVVDWSAVSAIASAVAAAAAAFAAFTSRAARQDDREVMKRAQLIGTFMKNADSTWLQVENLGPSAALDVRLFVNPLPTAMDLTALPSVLAPGQRVALSYRHIPAAPRHDAELTWTDGTGEARTVRIPVTLMPSSG